MIVTLYLMYRNQRWAKRTGLRVGSGVLAVSSLLPTSDLNIIAKGILTLDGLIYKWFINTKKALPICIPCGIMV